MPTVKIAIDGPAGAGKSTISKMLAEKIGYIYIDTGAMYRAVAFFAKKHGVDTLDVSGISAILDDINIDITHDDKGYQRVFLCGEDVSEAIRMPEISMGASRVSAIPAVRIKLVELQRLLASKHNCVMDGRDIGTYVLPDADLKLFLTADIQDRAKRRYEEQCTKGIECHFEDLLNDMNERDFNDSSREFAPLKMADNAIAINTTGNSLQQSFDAIYTIVREKLGR